MADRESQVNPYCWYTLMMIMMLMTTYIYITLWWWWWWWLYIYISISDPRVIVQWRLLDSTCMKLAMVKSALGTRECSALCRLIAKMERKKEILTLHPWKFICLLPSMNVMWNNFNARKYTSIKRPWIECLPMVQETWVQFQVASYQRL